MLDNSAIDRVSVEKQLRLMLSETSPVPMEEMDGSLKLVELGLSSLQLQILAAQLESVFQISFGEQEIGTLESLDQLIDAVLRHRRNGAG